MEAHVVHVSYRAKRGGEVEIRTNVHQEDAGIHKVGLALLFVGAQVGKKAIGRDQGHAGTGKPDSFTIKKTEDAASKGLRLADGVKSARGAVSGVSVAGGKKTRAMKAHPVPVHGQLQRRHLRINACSPVRDGIEI